MSLLGSVSQVIFFFCLCLLFFSFVSSYIGQVREYEDCLFEI